MGSSYFKEIYSIPHYVLNFGLVSNFTFHNGSPSLGRSRKHYIPSLELFQRAAFLLVQISPFLPAISSNYAPHSTDASGLLVKILADSSSLPAMLVRLGKTFNLFFFISLLSQSLKLSYFLSLSVKSKLIFTTAVKPSERHKR